MTLRELQARGPAEATSGATSGTKPAKFSANIDASRRAWASYDAGSRHVDRGSSSPVGHAGTAARHVDAEDRIGTGRHPIELALERRSDHRSRVAERHALPVSVRARPSSRCSPATRARRCCASASPQQRRVHAGAQRQERRAEARAERRRRLGDAALGARDFRRVAREEVIHRLRRASASRSAAARRTRRPSA